LRRSAGPAAGRSAAAAAAPSAPSAAAAASATAASAASVASAVLAASEACLASRRGVLRSAPARRTPVDGAPGVDVVVAEIERSVVCPHRACGRHGNKHHERPEEPRSAPCHGRGMYLGVYPVQLRRRPGERMRLSLFCLASQQFRNA
jgi:hypothetical protein